MFYLPYRVVIEEEALNLIPDMVSEFGCRKVLLVTDENIYSLYGRGVEDLLIESGVKVYSFFITASNIQNVENARRIVWQNDLCLVIGMGGGRPIDVAKYTAYLEKKTFISVPTAVSHDGFASPIVSLKDKDMNPMSIFTRPPSAVVIDLSVIGRAPRRLLRSGVGDLVGKKTSVADARLAQRRGKERVDEMSLYLASSAAEMVLSNIAEIRAWSPDGIKVLVEAGLLAGLAMSVAGSSRPCSGSEHLFSHAIDKVFPQRRSLHGEQVGIGAIMMAYLHGMDWSEIRDALKEVGAPTTAREIGVPKEKVIEALTIARTLRERYTILNEVELDEKSAEELAKRTGVID